MPTTKKKSPTPKKAWNVKLASCTAVTAHNNVVYAYVAVKSGFHFAALDAATGAPRWLGPGIGNLVSQPPIVTDAAVIVRQYNWNKLVILDAASGQQRHEVSCLSDVPEEGWTVSVFGPFLFGSRAVCVSSGPKGGAGGSIVAVDIATGRIEYMQPFNDGAAPEAAFADGDRLFVSLSRPAPPGHWQGSILALQGVDGTRLWNSEPGYTAQSAAHGYVVADARENRMTAQNTARGDDEACELVLMDGATGTVRFRRPMRGGFTPVALADRLICFDHHTDAALAIDPNTDAEIWATSSPHPPSTSTGFSAPMRRSHAIRDGQIWLTGSRDRIVSFSAADGAFRATNSRGFDLAADRDHLYIADSSSLTAFGFGG